MAQTLTGGSFARQDFLRAAGPFVICETQHRPRFFAPTHVHERPSVNVVLNGGYAEAGRGRSEIWPVGSVVAKPAWSAHTNHFREAGARCLLLEVQTTELDLVRRATDLFAVVDARDGRMAMHCVRQVQNEIRRGDSATKIALESAGYELIAILTRVARLEDERRPDSWLVRIREMVEQLPAERLSLGLLAREANRHPAHVARVFKRRHGVSVGQYLRHRRLVSASVDLRRTRRSVSSIATHHGFYDHSQFCREFRRSTGFSPTEYRNA